MHCIIVKTTIKPESRDLFLRTIQHNATASVLNETNCFVFDIIEDQEEENTFYLYEIYSDKEALQTHKTTEHYLKSREIINELVVKQSVVRGNVIARNPDA